MYHHILKLLFFLAGATVIFFVFGPRSVSFPDNLGLKNKLLSSCPRTPNCVSSQEKNSQNSIKPLTFEISPEQAKERLYQLINSMRGARIITRYELYWHVEFTSMLLRFIDDVEFYFDESESLIHVRSASRIGYWDLGVNRRRVETIRSGLNN